MTKDEFELLFDAEVTEPLGHRGFKRWGRSLYATENLAMISLIRLGGRMARPGAITHVLCCRMTFMRDRTEHVPEGFVSEVFDYPFKFLPSKLPAMLHYVPRNLNYDYELTEFQGRHRDAVLQDLVQIRSAIVALVLPWAGTLTEAAVKHELLTFGENAWCERMWIEDCDNQDE